MNNLDNSQLNIEEGTISFWIEKNPEFWSNNQRESLVSANDSGNGISIFKDDDNQLKFIHVLLKKGPNELVFNELDKLTKSKRHMFAFTWNVKVSLMQFYIDGVLVREKKMSYDN